MLLWMASGNSQQVAGFADRRAESLEDRRLALNPECHQVRSVLLNSLTLSVESNVKEAYVVSRPAQIAFQMKSF